MRTVVALVALLLLPCCSRAPVAPHDLFVRGPQGRLHVDDGGTPRSVPVVLIHGNGANLTQWKAQLAHLRSGRRAVALDLRGMGTSDRPANGDYSVAAIADDVEAVVTALRLQRFVVVGHSYGGAVAAQYAARQGDRVAAVVYADSAGVVNVDAAAAAKFQAMLRKDKDAVVRNWFAPILQHSSQPVQDAVFAAVHETAADAFVGALDGLGKIDMRLLVDGYRGPRFAIAAADLAGPSSFHTQFPSIPAKLLSGTGHWLMMDKPDEFNRFLDDILLTVR